jgi:hypothetical protein
MSEQSNHTTIVFEMFLSRLGQEMDNRNIRSYMSVSPTVSVKSHIDNETCQ